jgi:hypothetical protein
MDKGDEDRKCRKDNGKWEKPIKEVKYMRKIEMGMLCSYRTLE